MLKISYTLATAVYGGCKKCPMASLKDTSLDDASQALQIAYNEPDSQEVAAILNLAQDELKSKDSKYKRWSPRMDQVLVRLLSDVIHSFPKDGEPEMSRKAWAYVCGQLRTINPQTVYSTYTKYSCQQHLLNVIHHRYKVWYALLMHQRTVPPVDYSYRWNPDLGRFQTYDVNSSIIILDEHQIKSVLYSNAISLPALANVNRGALILNDFFFTDNLRYISLYHNEVLGMVMKLDPAFGADFEHVYEDIPKFDYEEAQNEYFKPLKISKPIKLFPSNHMVLKSKKRSFAMANESESLATANEIFTPDSVLGEESVDPLLKRSQQFEGSYDTALESASIAAIASPLVISEKSAPIYLKDRHWFNKLINLQRSSLISSEEVLIVCEGVRDGKIPLFALNVLDTSYFPDRESEFAAEAIDDHEMAKRIRQFMIPMTFSS